jgi:hypothetical protein
VATHHSARTVLAGAAVMLGFAGAGIAHADPSAFNVLSCTCRDAAPAGSPARSVEITQGIEQGMQSRPPSQTITR